jgi:RNA polymerase sigma-70 factor (ECF subfamily)
MTAAARMPAPAPPDHELVAAVANGNLEALGALFERHEPAVRRYLGRLGIAPSDADDLVQATFLEITHAAARFDPKYPARSWLLGIATVMVRRHRRSIGRAAVRVAAWAASLRSEPAPPRTPAELLEAGEAIGRVERAFARLSPKKREVFVLVTLEGLSGEEAASALQIPVNTVWTRLHHARRALRAALGEAER